MKKWGIWIVLALFTLVLGVYAWGGYVLYKQQEDFIFPGVKMVMRPIPELQPFGFTLIATDGTKLSGIAIESETKTEPIVLAFGGNAQDISALVLTLWKDIWERKASVVGFAYRGYSRANGKSEGVPTQESLYADALLQFDMLKAQYPKRKIMVLGYSLGTSMATYVAAKRDAEQLILVTPFTSMEDLALDKYPYYPVGQLLKYPFPSADYAVEVVEPVTVLAAETDVIVPMAQTKHMADTVQDLRVFEVIDGAGHNNILSFEESTSVLRGILD